MDAALLSHRLEEASDARLAKARVHELGALRGVRGTPDGVVARVAAEAWKEHGFHPDHDRDQALTLFSSAFEDGIVAIALAAAALPDDPEAAFELAEIWLDRVDDPLTADALGSLLLGPASIATGRDADALARLAQGHRPEARRAVIASALAWLPAPLTGPGLAALRERLGTREVRMVDAPRTDAIAALATAFARDDAPTVRKALRRLLRAWTDADPAAVVAWADGIKGGLQRMLGDEVLRARRKAGRKA